MKVIKYFLGLIFFILITAYVVLLTPLNKTIFVPIIKDQIVKVTKSNNVEIIDFELSINNFKIKISLNDQIIFVDSKFDIISQTLDLQYDIKIDNLSKLEKIITQKLNGSFYTNGNVKGNLEKLNIIGLAKIAKGNINYKFDLNVKEKDLKDIIVKVSNLNIEKVFLMINQPQYTKANLDMDIKIKSLVNLNGKVNTSLKNGLLNTNIIQRDFNIFLPSNPKFTLNINSIIDKNIISSKVDFKSFALDIFTKKTLFNIDTSVLNTDYKVEIPELENLFFITHQKMRGAIDINGNVKFNKYVIATFNSDIFGGKMTGNFIKDIIKVNIKDIESLKILHTLYYPEVLKSKLDLDLNYNLTTKIGVSDIDMRNAIFTINNFKKLKKITHKDISEELYTIATIKTNINNLHLDNKLNMVSTHSTIESKKLILDLDKGKIDGNLFLKYYKFNLKINIDGDIVSPNVSVDYKDAVKVKVKKEINEFLKDKFGKTIGEDVKKDVKKIGDEIKDKAKKELKKIGDEIKKDAKKKLGDAFKKFF